MRDTGGMYEVIRRVAIVTISAALLVSGIGCRESGAPPDSIARVGSRYVTYEEFEHYLDRMIGDDVGLIEPEASSAMLDQMLETILLSQFAVAQGVTVSADEVEAAVAGDSGSTPTEKRDDLQREGLITKLSGTITDPTEEEIREYHQQHVAEFTIGERAHLRQILLKDEAQAKRLRNEIVRGKPFEDAARENSLSPTAERGGDIGTVTRGDLPKAVETAVFDLSAGQVSKVIETSGTFHIFKMIEKLPAGVLDLDRTRPLIVSRTRGEHLSRLIAEVTAEARQKIPALVFPARLDFEYTGSFPVDRSE